MRSSCKTIAVFALSAIVVAGVAAGTVMLCDEGVRERLSLLVNRARGESKIAADALSEDVILKKAKIKNDPSVNQSWTENQWDAIY